jgi:polar amino acid transport system substrate-binding protein
MLIPQMCILPRRTMTRRVLLLLLGAVLLLGTALAACGGDDDGGGGDTGGAAKVDTLQSGTLTVGSDIPYAPFEFGDPPDYDGFDVNLVDAIAKRLDLKVKWVKTPFDTIFRNLAQGKFDMVASSATITDERKRTVDFSDPYFAADQSLMVKRGSDIRTVADVDGQIVGAQLGTTGAAYAKDETDAKEVRTYDLVDDAFKALETGQVAAVINDCPVSAYAMRSKPDLEVVEAIKTGESYGFAFEKGSGAVRTAVNRALGEVRSDGTYNRIFKKWFGNAPCRSIADRGAAGQ